MSDPYRISARFYDSLFESMNQGLRLIGLRLYLPRAGTAILDVGCGTGAHLTMYQRYNTSLSGIDSSPSMLSLARKRLGNSADLRLADAAKMPFPSSTFDLVLAMLSLHEMAQKERAQVLTEMMRVMKDDGRTLLIDFHPGRVSTLQGWWTRVVILLSEIAAGRKHFRHFRQFMRLGGLPPLLQEAGLEIEKQRVVAGGPLALFLARKPSSH